DDDADDLGERRLAALHDRLVEHAAAVDPLAQTGDRVDDRHRLDHDLDRDEVGQDPVAGSHDVLPVREASSGLVLAGRRPGSVTTQRYGQKTSRVAVAFGVAARYQALAG